MGEHKPSYLLTLLTFAAMRVRREPFSSPTASPAPEPGPGAALRGHRGGGFSSPAAKHVPLLFANPHVVCVRTNRHHEY